MILLPLLFFAVTAQPFDVVIRDGHVIKQRFIDALKP